MVMQLHYHVNAYALSAFSPTEVSAGETSFTLNNNDLKSFTLLTTG